MLARATPLGGPAPGPSPYQWAVKHALDRVLAAALLLVCLPLLAASAVAVWVSLGRPIFFTQTRVGRNGRAFRIWKLRTLRPGASPDGDTGQVLQEGLAPGGCDDASRQTSVGALLRRTALDELPQLFNVVRGEMSLVGPRPELPCFVTHFERSVDRYRERHRVKPGITGWAQIHGLRGRTSIDLRCELDNHYIENFSLAMDLKILLRTLLIVGASLVPPREQLSHVLSRSAAKSQASDPGSWIE
jgi:lipopolysaccharide/colanic/teichoic acid biosynthesis glycosyltransferase